MNIVVTGFEAFHTNGENPTEEVVKLLPRSIRGHKLYPLLLPVLYKESFDKFIELIKDIDVDVIIHLGLAGGREGITPERIAVNLNDASIKDNNGVILRDKKIIEDGENAYFSTLPIKQIVSKLKEKHIDAYISNSAGLYVCNDLMYRTLHYINKNNLNIKAGFIHVPFMDEQDSKGKYSMPLPSILEGVIDAIKLSF